MMGGFVTDTHERDRQLMLVRLERVVKCHAVFMNEQTCTMFIPLGTLMP